MEHTVVFVDGVHYPINDDGTADLNRPLRWNPETHDYRDAEEGEPLHNDVHHQREVEIASDDQIEIAPDEADAVREFLKNLRGEA